MLTDNYDMTTILGPTASGKTALAVALAARTNAEIVSADSRQVYRRMDLGTGKDLADYDLGGGRKVAHHLIDIAEPGTRYNVFEYQRDFLNAYADIRNRGKRVVVCGGSGLYLESVLRGYRLSPVEPNEKLREELANKTLAELTEILASYRPLHNHTDVDTAARAIRAIEIEEHYRRTPVENRPFPKLTSLTLGIDISRDERRRRITLRLKQRLEDGMADEVKSLLAEGIKPEDLMYYGLEYKYVTLYVTGQLTYEEMFRQLEIAIHQFAKRQMTWFRGMERRGINIVWIKAGTDAEERMWNLLDSGSE